VNRLHITGVDDGFGCELIFLVDGRDLLVEMGAAGLDPDELLPRLDLSHAPATVRIGRCECGSDACGSVTVHIESDGDSVVWDAWASSFSDDLPPPLRFERRQYLGALKAADSRQWESPERRFSRRTAGLVDQATRAALAWRGLQFENVVPAGDGLAAVWLRARYRDARWSVYVIVAVSDEPESVRQLLTRRGPTAWPNVVWWGENEAAAFQQPPMAGRRWRMWQPVDA
jgi:hypothetical protein